MTAEIAILNKLAVTLAADSAVTLKTGGDPKVYNSADKIFEATNHDPIGLMVYNSPEVHGIPVEILTKKFRDKHCDCSYDTVFDFAAAFLRHLESIPCPSVTTDENIFWSVLPEILRMRDLYNVEVNNAVETAMQENGADADGVKEAFQRVGEIVNESLQVRLNELRAMPSMEWSEDLTSAGVREAHNTVIGQAIEHAFGEMYLVPGVDETLADIAAEYLLRSEDSERLTGLVFAGFGGKEIFPSLVSYEVYGSIAGKLKFRKTRKFDVDRALVPVADIIPFAQQQMVDRFILGIDSAFLEMTTSFFSGAMQTIGRKLEEVLEGGNKDLATKVAAALPEATNAVMEEFTRSVVPEHLQGAKAQMDDVVRFMPKQELAALAESLVNITSLKRRFSSEAESVGGPIDVAVITRAEGFVWVKRKHFFEASLNPRYFYRRYGQWTNSKGEQA